MTVGAGVTVTPVARHASRPDQRKSGAYPKATASQLAQLRLERQERLLGERNIHLWAVIDEAALHRQVGGTQVMREQIGKLIELKELDDVTVQVLPFSAGAHVGQNGAFSIMEFADPESPAVVYQETLISNAYLEEPSDVERYRMAYDQLRAAGLSPAASVALMARIQTAL